MTRAIRRGSTPSSCPLCALASSPRSNPRHAAQSRATPLIYAHVVSPSRDLYIACYASWMPEGPVLRVSHRSTAALPSLGASGSDVGRRRNCPHIRKPGALRKPYLAYLGRFRGKPRYSWTLQIRNRIWGATGSPRQALGRQHPKHYTAPMLDRIRFVLVRPIRSGNVGSVSRAMMNMGLSDLVLVDPACDRSDGQAQGFAARAKPLLDAARIVSDLPGALSDCVMTFAASAKGGFHRRRVVIEPHEAAEMAIAAAARGPIAIAFGPEDRGLLQEEILDFDRVIEIPASPEYPAMNLADRKSVV